VVEHALEHCPDCGTTLKGGWVQRTREVIELALAPAEVVEHRYIARICPGCNHDIPPRTFHVVAVPRRAPDLRRHWHKGCWEHRARRRPGTVR
jgi:hypothetical protein